MATLFLSSLNFCDYPVLVHKIKRGATAWTTFLLGSIKAASAIFTLHCLNGKMQIDRLADIFAKGNSELVIVFSDTAARIIKVFHIRFYRYITVISLNYKFFQSTGAGIGGLHNV